MALNEPVFPADGIFFAVFAGGRRIDLDGKAECAYNRTVYQMIAHTGYAMKKIISKMRGRE